jgi:hypothetical protein
VRSFIKRAPENRPADPLHILRRFRSMRRQLPLDGGEVLLAGYCHGYFPVNCLGGAASAQSVPKLMQLDAEQSDTKEGYSSEEQEEAEQTKKPEKKLHNGAFT